MSFNTFRIAQRALTKNKMRAALTVLGIVIGIAAVTTMVSVGQSASGLVLGEIQNMGTNLVMVFPGTMRGPGVRDTATPKLTASDAVAIAEDCPGVVAVSPILIASGQVIYGNTNWNPSNMMGVGPDYPLIGRWEMRRGEFFTQSEVTAAAKVCVIGQTIVARLFQTTNPVGEVIRIKNIPFRIVGVLEAKGANMGGEDQDNVVLMPHTTVRKRLQGSTFDNVSFIMVSARSPEQTTEAMAQIDRLLQERHHIRPGQPTDFVVRSSMEIANIAGIITGTLTLMLAAIAAISLLVGGVGIMNIMLVSVTERTREIGIRMAVGARGRDILRQFLVESVMLSTIGGAVGVALGIGASVGITQLINHFTSGRHWPIVVSVPATLIALAFAAAVGIFFGYYPALRASKLDPIEALRYE